MSTDLGFSAPIAWICYLIPSLYLVGASLTALLGSRGQKQAWGIASSTAALGLLGALGFAAALGLASGGLGVHPVADPLGALLGGSRSGARVLSVRLDVLTAVMLVLVTFVGWIVVRFSRRYLDGDSEQQAYLRRLQLTLAAVCALISSNNLLTIAALWIATSLSLHGLLTHFRERTPAQIAAHKKFLLSRLADISLLSAVALLATSLQTVELDRLFDALRVSPSLPAPVAAAAVLIAVTALLKCAQLPFHGWLIQVMEAPTPVSALLHAGIVNIGGFLMIRLAPLMTRADAAQNLLLVLGLATATVSALVMLTRISIKVMLAWSTCAQMGLMLVECALGAYEVALLHLVAHSLYKAHAFLSAGSALANHRVAAMSPELRRFGFAATLASGLVAVLTVTAALSAFGTSVASEPRLWFPVALLSLALPEMWLNLRDLRSPKLLGSLVLSGLGLALMFGLVHSLFERLLPVAAQTAEDGPFRAGLAVGAITVLFIVHAWLRQRPSSAFARWLYLRAFAGFHLDEVFTRMTFRIWPAKLTTTSASDLPLPEPSGSTHS